MKLQILVTYKIGMNDTFDKNNWLVKTFIHDKEKWQLPADINRMIILYR